MYNSLLKRQIQRTLKNEKLITPEWQELLNTINRSYEHYERDHVLSQHSLNISSNELAEKETRLQSIIEAASDGIIVLDARGRIETCNRAVCQIFAKKENEIIFHNILTFVELNNQHQADKLTFEDFTQKVQHEQEFLYEQPNGTKIPLELKISHFNVSDDIFYVILMRDITKKKQQQEEIKKLNSNLIEASRMIGMGEMANSILHNIGNVLNSILISVQTIIKETKDSKISQLESIVAIINSNVNNLDEFFKKDPTGKLIPDYLTQFVQYHSEENNHLIENLESLNEKIKHIKELIQNQQSFGKSSLLLEEVNINDIIKESLRINFSDINISLIFGLNDLPKIKSDRVKIIQVIINVLKNSLESLHESTKKDKWIRISTSYLHQTDQIKIEIKDNGIGVSKQNLPKIFTNGFSTKPKGNGIGLHSSSILLQTLGGKIKLESQGLNEGATITILLPVHIDKKDLL